MSFRANDSSVNQTSILDATELMSEREKRFLKQSWAKVFAEEIFRRSMKDPLPQCTVIRIPVRTHRSM